jgi:6-phosphogluconolactonase
MIREVFWLFTIETNGALTPVPGSPFAIPGQMGAASQPMGIVDNGSFVYVALWRTNQIAAFSVNPATGGLSPVAGSLFPAGNAPSFLTLADEFLYTDSSTAVDCDISGYSVNSTTGALTPIPGSPFNTCGDTITTDASGKYLYTTIGRFVDSLAIDPNTGALTDVGSHQFGFLEPYWITVVQFH